jgi:hypothetical protein
MGTRQESLVGAAILAAMSLSSCTPERRSDARPSPTPTVYSFSHGGYYVHGRSGAVYMGSTAAKAVEAEEQTEGDASHRGEDGAHGDGDGAHGGDDGAHGGFGGSGAGGDAGG